VQYNISLKNGTYLFLNDIVEALSGRDELGDYTEFEDNDANVFIVYRDKVNSMVRVVQPDVEVMQ
jgi:hypothetical protein